MANQNVSKKAESSKPRSKVGTYILIIIIMLAAILLVLLVVYGYFYFSSDKGQRSAANFKELIGKYNPVTWYTNELSKAEDLSQNLWTTKQNATSFKKGLMFKSFKAISTEEFPQGSPISFEYNLQLENMNVQDLPITVQCSINNQKYHSNYSQEGDIKVVPNGGLIRISGNRIYDDIRCIASPQLTKKLSGTLTFVGSVNFPFQTKDVTLPIYFTSREMDQQLEGEDFFKYFKIQESQPIQAMYDGEPIEVGIGVSTENRQPVIIGQGRNPLVGISLKNRWDGFLSQLTSLSLTVPKEMTLNKELSASPNPLCPFELLREGATTKEYKAIPEYIKDISLKKDRIKSFECWFDADTSIIDGGAYYSKKSYKVTADYIYNLGNKTASVTIKSVKSPLNVGTEIIVGSANPIKQTPTETISSTPGGLTIV